MISVISWWPVFLMEKTKENHWPVASNWQTKNHALQYDNLYEVIFYLLIGFWSFSCSCWTLSVSFHFGNLNLYSSIMVMLYLCKDDDVFFSRLKECSKLFHYILNGLISKLQENVLISQMHCCDNFFLNLNSLCDKVCQWLVAGQWFSLGSPVSSTTKTDGHDITEILLKVALNSLTLLIFFFLFCLFC
jgi:hypothetical protein